MKRITGYCLLLLFLTKASEAQRSISIGQTVPALTFNNIINYKAKTARSTDFKDKLLILDFWGTFCPPCVQLLPHYDSLQRKFNKEVQFMLVSTETPEKVLAFFNKHHYSLPSITADKELWHDFPHIGIPHEVWIKDGKVLATSFGDALNENTITRALNNQPLNFDMKEDNFAYDDMKPLLVNGNGGQGNVYYQSIITPYMDGLMSGEGNSRDSVYTRSDFINGAAINIYHQAFSHLDPFLNYDNRTILNVPDSIKYKLVKPAKINAHEWFKKYGFCYSLYLPSNYKGNIGYLMANDLNNFFGAFYGISARLEKRTMDCLVLSRIAGAPSINSKGGDKVYKGDTSQFVLKNLPFSYLTNVLSLQYRKLQTPLIDESGYNGPVDISLPVNTEALEALKGALQAAGLELSIRKRTIDMVVISPAQ